MAIQGFANLPSFGGVGFPPPNLDPNMFLRIGHLDFQIPFIASNNPEIPGNYPALNEHARFADARHYLA